MIAESGSPVVHHVTHGFAAHVHLRLSYFPK